MLTIQKVYKSYGTKQVLKDINFSVQNGHITGLIGKNGSGKTTLFRCILNFLDYSGKINIDNHKFNAQDYNSVGFLPEERSLMPKLTIYDQIHFLAQLKGLSTNQIKTQLPLWLKRLAVKGKITDKIKSLSKGNQQKIQMIATLMHQPNLIILDEPFSGLDPVNVDLMKKIVLEEKRRGAAIIFSDHNMRNVEELCDDVVMINEGQLAFDGTVNEVRNNFGMTRLFIRVDLSKDQMINLPGVTEVTKMNNGSYRLILADAKYGKEIFEQLSGGKYIRTFDQEPPTLNEIFKMKAGEYHE